MQKESGCVSDQDVGNTVRTQESKNGGGGEGRELIYTPAVVPSNYSAVVAPMTSRLHHRNFIG